MAAVRVEAVRMENLRCQETRRRRSRYRETEVQDFATEGGSTCARSCQPSGGPRTKFQKRGRRCQWPTPEPPKAKVSKATLREPPIFLIREQKAWIRAEHGGEYGATFERGRAPECEHLLARRHVAHILSDGHTPEGARSFVNRAFDIHLEG